jgi:hypothetical protein
VSTAISSEALNRLHPCIHELLNSCPVAGDGVHDWLFNVARHLLPHFDEQTTQDLVLEKATGCGRPIRKLEREIANQIRGALPCQWRPRNPGAFKPAGSPAPITGSVLTTFIPAPGWPPNQTKIRQIVDGDLQLVDLIEHSPIRFDDPASSHVEEIIDVLFPGDPLLCVGESSYLFATRRRKVWRGHLARLPLIVPNPMLDVVGRTAEGRLSEHTKEQTARRVYLVIEFDFAEFGRDGKTPSRWAPLVREWRPQDKAIADVCAALLLHLAERLALVCVTHSGGKSLHGWFRASNKTVRELRRFMEYAVTLGADHATWTRSQFVRIPDGLRENGKRQLCYYLDPGKAVKL